jgi:hypothetical protein
MHMKTNPNKLWIVAIALGWLFDFLFWKKAPGVNFSIFAALCLAGAFYLLLGGGLRPNRNSLLILPFIGFFAVVTFVRAEPMTAFLSHAFTLLAMTVLAVTYLGGRWIQYTIADYLAKFMNLLVSMISLPLVFSGEVRKAQAQAGVPPSRRNIWPVVRGAIIALPVVAVFASLLASADVVFSQRLDAFIELFNLEKLPEYIFRLIYILVIANALAGVILHAASQSGDEKLVGEDKPFIPPFLGSVEAFIVLGGVVALFAAFVVIQFQYFFGGQANIHIDGYTYSEYARRGFGELVVVAFLSLLMLLVLSAVTKRETETQRRIFSGLGVALVALVLVMLVSAYQRLVLYEAAYGFSRLRAYTHVFLVWIGLLLVATIVLEVLRKERAFALAAVIASLGFAMSLPILNVDAFIVRQNIQREIHTDQDDADSLDAWYFIGLSDDAVPELVSALRTPSVPDSVKDKVAASLACIRYERGLSVRDLPWQSFHLSRFTADRELASIKKTLDAYKIVNTDWPVTVTTPQGKEFFCSPYDYD